MSADTFFIPRKSAGGISTLPIDSQLYGNRDIWIDGGIEPGTASLVAKQILCLNRESEESPIVVFVNSHGGQIRAGMLIYDAIRDSAAPVYTVCCGEAYSMGAVLVCCGHPGRFILPHSKMMLHEPLIGSQIGGNTSSIRELSQHLENEKEEMDKILSLHTGQPMDVIAEATSYDHFFDASEAVAFGLADRIITFGEIIRGEFSI